MRKHLYLTLLLLTGGASFGSLPVYGDPVPQQSQASAVIQGSVLDENNEPVIGASVVQKGVRNNAVATDAFGNFKIRVPMGSLLEVSYVGYQTMSIKAADGMTVYLQPTTEMLNELVAIGYGSQKRANLTGAVATVDVARTMESRPQQDVMKALQGAVPGLTILNNTGNIDGTPVIKIRGTGTLSNSATSNPLYVVDGVAMDDISYLNPEEIKEISVLKDASSSAIYGSRAAFGVLLITTKSGEKADRIQVKYSNNFGWSQATVLPGINNSVSSLEAMNEAAKMLGKDQGEFFGMYYTDILPYARKWYEQNSGKITEYREARPYVDENNVGDYYVDAQGRNFLPYADYDINKIFMNDAAPSNQHNVSINGTTGRATFNLAFGYAKRQSLVNFNPDKATRYNAKA
ncbi:MAG: TonB-dependent receptor plug domain-containing protein, partial [Muribaculaceae bacterium]|nr:TonB-dependent receptor plug domain-containing protein [Muribaculaceae bacterium]